MAKLVITEKPSVARQFAKALNVSGNQDGYIEGGDWVITWCVGHLVTLSYPQVYDEKYSKWKMEDLPFLPADYKYEVLKNTKAQFAVIKKLINRKDISEIYNAGDSGREGEYIQRLVYMMTGYNKNAKMLRVWIDSQTDAEILRGIKEAAPAEKYDNLSKAAYMRAIEDYAFGINFSRALSIKFGYEFNKKIAAAKYTPIPVGRVMTCVLGMIVDRENEIRNFQPTQYYKIDAFHQTAGFTSHWKAVPNTSCYGSSGIYNDIGFLSKEDAEAFTEFLSEDPVLKVEKIEKKAEKKNAPLLYNLAELQNDCSKKFRISPDETLAITQKLYEAKLVTYPRTDARVISTAVAKEIEKNIRGVSNFEFAIDIASQILTEGWHKGVEKSKYCDDKKITDHYAIIPTGEQSAYEGLNNLEKGIFQLITKRFLAIFFPAAEYSKLAIELCHSSGEKFFASEKKLVKPGYLEVYGKEDEKEDEDEQSAATGIIGDIKEGQALVSEFSLNEKTTQPPNRYTSGSIILAMENAGKLIEDPELREQIKSAGIGTSATRAEIIKKIVDNKHVKLEKKTQVLSPTEIGEAIYDIVKKIVPVLLSPKMTASWEKGLSQIEAGQVTDAQYRQMFEKYVTDTVNKIKAAVAEGYTPTEKKVVGKCPICGADLVENKIGWGCSAYKGKDSDSCSFLIKREICGYEFTDKEMIALINGETLGPYDNFVSKKGNKFSASVKVQDGEVKLLFDTGGDFRSTDIKCPGCGNDMEINEQYIKCSCGKNYKIKIANYRIPDEQVKILMETGHTNKISGFIGKKGPFDAKLKLDGDLITFDFPPKKENFK